MQRCPVPISESMTLLLVTHRTHREAQPQQGRVQAPTAKIPDAAAKNQNQQSHVATHTTETCKRQPEEGNTFSKAAKAVSVFIYSVPTVSGLCGEDSLVRVILRHEYLCSEINTLITCLCWMYRKQLHAQINRYSQCHDVHFLRMNINKSQSSNMCY